MVAKLHTNGPHGPCLQGAIFFIQLRKILWAMYDYFPRALKLRWSYFGFYSRIT